MNRVWSAGLHWSGSAVVASACLCCPASPRANPPYRAGLPACFAHNSTRSEPVVMALKRGERSPSWLVRDILTYMLLKPHTLNFKGCMFNAPLPSLAERWRRENNKIYRRTVKKVRTAHTRKCLSRSSLGRWMHSTH